MLSTLFAACGLCFVASATASPRGGVAATPHPRALLPTADTEASRFGLDFRGALRARFGQPLPLVRTASEMGYFLDMVPLLELHNDPHPDGFLPSENWRAAIALESGYRFELPFGFTDLGLHIGHESDHSTARFDEDAHPWFLSLNHIGFRGRLVGVVGPLVIQTVVLPKLYLATCTRLFACEKAFQGSASAGAAADITVTTSFERWGLRPFVAVHGAGIVPRSDIVLERRVVFHVGICRRGAQVAWDAYTLGFFGNEVGFARAQQVVRFGVGLRLWIDEGRGP